MRRLLVVSIGASCAIGVWGGQKVKPFDIKPGLWEEVLVMNMRGQPPIPPEVLAKMTPEQRARFDAAMKARGTGEPTTHTRQRCITKEDLAKNPFDDKRPNCTYDVVRSSERSMEVHAVCKENNFNLDLDIQAESSDTEHFKVVSHSSAAGQTSTMKSDVTMTGKWIGATCPAENK